MSLSILIEVLIAGNGFALLAFGIGQLLVKGKRSVNYWSFAFFSYAAALFIYTAVVHTGFVVDSSALVLMDFPLVSNTGPLFFFYLSRLADPSYRFAWREQWLFAPPLASAIASALAYAAAGEGAIQAAARASSASVLWLILCCALFLARTARRRREGRSGEGRRLRFLVGIAWGVIAWAVLFYLASLSDVALVGLVLASTLFIMALYFYHLRHPELLSPPAPPAAPSSRGRSKVLGLDLEATIDRLTRIMEDDKPYLREDLSLSALAAKLRLSPHQLSELLNQEMGTTFKSFINQHRVKEARRILREKLGATVLEVALECGFRSKSAFNKLFQEATGTTPTEYRRRAGT